VDENVFAYSNRLGDERVLVIYHNRYADTRGWIKVSAAALDKNSGQLVQKTLGEALGLPREGYAVFRDYTSHLEFIRPCAEIWERGIYAELAAYHCHVFMDWWFVDGERWAEVHQALNGAGVDSVQAKYDEMFAGKVEVVEEVKVKKPRKKAASKKAESGKKTSATKGKAEKTSAATKSKKAETVKKAETAKKSATAKKPVTAKKPAAKKTATTSKKSAAKKPASTKTSTTKKPTSKKTAKSEK
jgi:hypothetical protein